MDNMENIFTSSEQVENLRKSFEKLGFDPNSAVQELEQNKYQLVAKSSCRHCWGTGNIHTEEGWTSSSFGKGLVDKLCHCVKVKKRK